MSRPVIADVALQKIRRAAHVVDPGGESAPSKPYVSPGRARKVHLTAFFEKPVKKQLRAIGLENDKTLQDLLREAVNDLFAKYGRPEIAE